MAPTTTTSSSSTTTTTTMASLSAAAASRTAAALPRRALPRAAGAAGAAGATQRACYHDLSSSEYTGQGSRKGDSPADKPWYASPTTLLLGFIPVFTAGLGFWQLQRLKWKVSLIEELEHKLRKQPIVLPRNVNLDALDAFEFRLVELEGSFDPNPEHVLFLGPRVKDGILGYQVVVPFRRASGGADVLVNRGFVAESQTIGKGAERRLRNPDALREGKGDGGLVKLNALLPRIYPPNAFTPANEPATNSWFHADPKQMAAHLSPPASSSLQDGAASKMVVDDEDEDHYTPSAGVAASVSSLLSWSSSSSSSSTSSAQAEQAQAQHPPPPRPVLPILLEEIFDGHAGEASARVSAGLPLGRAPTIELRNQHAVYAATWFSLSAATAAMFGILVRKGARKGR